VLATAPLATMNPESVHLMVATEAPVNLMVLAPENPEAGVPCGFHCTAAAGLAATPSAAQATIDDIQIRKRRMALAPSGR
jgi:hypothetical protein